MLESEKIAIAAHLHVLLRRVTGRVTDTEWMATNAEYAAAVTQLARVRAQEDNRPDLAEWASKLEAAMELRPQRAIAPQPAVRSSSAPADEISKSRYIGGLR